LRKRDGNIQNDISIFFRKKKLGKVKAILSQFVVLVKEKMEPCERNAEASSQQLILHLFSY